MKRYVPAATLFMLVLPLGVAAGADANWSVYLGGKESSHYSSLDQITPENVAKLAPAWTYHAGGIDRNNRSQIQCNPLIVDGVLYGTTPDLVLFALAADSGKPLWQFNPTTEKGITKGGVNRAECRHFTMCDPMDKLTQTARPGVEEPTIR